MTGHRRDMAAPSARTPAKPNCANTQPLRALFVTHLSRCGERLLESRTPETRQALAKATSLAGVLDTRGSTHMLRPLSGKAWWCFRSWVRIVVGAIADRH